MFQIKRTLEGGRVSMDDCTTVKEDLEEDKDGFVEVQRTTAPTNVR